MADQERFSWGGWSENILFNITHRVNLKWLFSQRPEGRKTRAEHILLLLQLLVSNIVRALDELWAHHVKFVWRKKNYSYPGERAVVCVFWNVFGLFPSHIKCRFLFLCRNFVVSMVVVVTCVSIGLSRTSQAASFGIPFCPVHIKM